MLYELRWSPLSQRRHATRLILGYKIINGLAEVPFESIFIEAYKGTKTKQNKKLGQIGNIKMVSILSFYLLFSPYSCMHFLSLFFSYNIYVFVYIFCLSIYYYDFVINLINLNVILI